MKTLLIISLLLSGQTWISTGMLQIKDPTGTYILKGRIKKNEIWGHSGEIRVKRLETHRLALSFFMNKGYPGYESGAFIDTLWYEDQLAKYSPPTDTDCILLFVFDETTIELRQAYQDPHCSCGFGKGVLISSSFIKQSDETPIIQDLSLHGRLQ